MICIGYLTQFDGNSVGKICRLNTDGSFDSTFNPLGSGFNLIPNNLVVLSDDSIVVTGSFTTYNGVSANRIVKLTSNGAIDGTFVYGTGFNGTTRSILESNNNLFITGTFTTYNGSSVARGIIKLSLTGTLNSTFNTNAGTGLSVTAYAYDSTETADGNLVFIVPFALSNYNGTTTNGIFKITQDGLLVNQFLTTSGFNSNSQGLISDNQNRVIVVGNFSTYSSLKANGIVRLLPCQE